MVTDSSTITSITDVRTVFHWNSITGSGGPSIQVNGANASKQSVLNFVNGTYLTVSSPSSGQIKYDITSLPNIGIAGGGAGQTTALGAFNALSPLTTEGDLGYFYSGNNARLGIGPNGYVPGSNGTDPVWTNVGATITFQANGTPLTNRTTINCVNSTYLTCSNPCAGQIQVSLTGLPIQPLSAGGTGQVTAAASFNALSPATTEGDLIYRHSGNGPRLAVGTSSQVLCSDGTDPYWCVVSTNGFASQYPNRFFAGPASAPAAAPTFRGLTAADMPSNIASNTTGSAAALAGS